MIQTRAEKLYEMYVKNEIVLAPIDENRQSLDKRFPLYSGRVYTSYQELEAWCAYGYTIGIALGSFSKFIAIEVPNVEGHLILSAWSHNKIPPTWQFIYRTNPVFKGGARINKRHAYEQPSHFYIFRLPDGFIPVNRFTFYTEAVYNSESLDSNTKPTATSNLFVWGQGSYLPLPEEKYAHQITEIRNPQLMKSYSGIPLAPKWLLSAIEGNTVKKFASIGAKAFIPMFCQDNLVLLTGGKVLFDKAFEIYREQSYQVGEMPANTATFAATLTKLGYKIGDRTTNGKRKTYIKNVVSRPYSRLDAYLRS